MSVFIERTELLAYPTLSAFALPLPEFEAVAGICRTMELNLAGVPALPQPVRTEGPLPASLQLFGPHGARSCWWRRERGSRRRRAR